MLQWIKHHNVTLKNIALFFGLSAVFFYSLIAFAAPASAQSIADPNSTLNEGVNVIQEPLGLPAFDIRIIIARIIRIALSLIGIVMVVLILYAGYLWMTAGGNEEQIGQAKKIIQNAVIGLVIVLSAYSIVAFVMRMLGIGDGGIGPGNNNPPQQQNYIGSGALGRIVKDHYPMRDQVDVPRNTKIVITFRRPIKVDSVIENTNALKDNRNLTWGDCINIGKAMDWKTDCDTLKSGADRIVITRADTGEVVTSTALATFDSEGKVYTIVMRPWETLGSGTEKIAYKVRVGKDVLLDDATNNNPSIFFGTSVGNDYYEWQFTCDTVLDSAPPHVLSVYPDKNATEAKNSVIQIDFSEAMDPIGMQGAFGESQDGYYVISGSHIFLKNNSSTVPLGDFNLTNGYRTLEFTPTIECGKNACGSTIYCLPVCDRPGANCDRDTYRMILKTAEVYDDSRFEAAAFSGVMDLSSNALDASVPFGDKPQIPTTSLPVFDNWRKEDNFFWNFTLENRIDATAPYLRRVSPGVEGEFIGANDDWKMLFSKRMRVEPMYRGVTLDEKDINPSGPNIPLWYVPRVSFGLETKDTLVTMMHGPFDQSERHYYFPSISSEVEDVNFNCLYPGKGPTGFDPDTKESNTCDPANFNNPDYCCQVTSTPQTSAYCCNGAVNVNATTSQSCAAAMKKISL